MTHFMILPTGGGAKNVEYYSISYISYQSQNASVAPGAPLQSHDLPQNSVGR